MLDRSNFCMILANFEGLAGLKFVAVKPIGGGGGGGGSSGKKKKVKDRFMELWQKVIFPVRRVLVAVSARVKSRKNGDGLLKLHDDVRTCGYEDVQVMWEMLSRSESELLSNNAKRKPRSFWRVRVWSNHSRASSYSTSHA